MKSRINPFLSCHSFQISVFVVATSIVSLLTAPETHALTYNWSNTATDFNASGSWATLPTATDIGAFGSTVTFQPQLTASTSIQGLTFAVSGWNLSSSSSSNVLTIGSSGVTTSGTGTTTISANIGIGATQSWTANSPSIQKYTGSITNGTSVAGAVANKLTLTTGSSGSFILDPSGSNSVAYYGTTASAGVIAFNADTSLGSALNSTSSTNYIVNTNGMGGTGETNSFSILAGKTLTVNSGTWNTNTIGRNSGAEGAVNITLNGGTLATNGGRYAITANGSVGGTWTINGGTFKEGGSSLQSGGGQFGIGGAYSGTITSAAVMAVNLQNGFVDVAKGNSASTVGGSVTTSGATGAPSALFNQSGGVAQFGVTATTNFVPGFTVNAAATTNQNLTIGAASTANGAIKAAYTLTSGRLLVAGTLAGNAPGNLFSLDTGVSNFNFMGGTLTAGTITATNLGSNSSATATANQVSASNDIGTLVNYGGTLAPGGSTVTNTPDIYGNASLSFTPISGKTTITGGYKVSSSNAILALNLGSTTIATGFQSGAAFYDTIAMTGALTLGGKLNVSLINSFGSTITSLNTFNVITGASSNTGTFTNVNASTGRVNLVTTAGSLATGSMVFTRGATSTLGSYAAGHDLIWLGDGTTNAWNTATANWNAGVGTNTTFADGDFVTFDDTGSQSPAVALNVTLSPMAVVFANTSGTYSLSGSGKISGAATVTVQGAGSTVSLNTANDYTGASAVTAGTLKLGNATALGTTASGTSVTAGAVLDLNGQAVGAEALTLNGTGISSGGALINSIGTSASLSGLVTFSTGTSIGGTGNLTLSGGIAATASTNNLIKVGAGTVTLSAAATTNRSTVNATTQIDGGVLRIQNATALATGTTAVTTINGGVLELNGGITLDQPISLNNGGTVRSDGTNASNGKITVSTAVAANSVTLSTVGSGDVFTVGNGSNDISGGNGTDDTINIAGLGTVVLAQASDYIGNWSFNAGTTQIGSITALGATAASTITLNGGALNGRLASSTIFTANPITVTANSSLNADRSSSGAGVSYTFGSLSIGANTLNVSSTAAVTSGTGGVIVGAINLSGNATFNITNGTTATTLFTVGAITDNGNQLTLTGSGNFAQSSAWATGTAGSLRLGGSGGAAYSGTATLNQANTFTGGVAVNSGVLLIGGTATATGSTINTSATGTGNVAFASGTSVNSANGATWFAPTITLGGAGSTLNLIGGNRLAVAYKTLDLGDTARSGVTTLNVNSKALSVSGGNTLTTESTGLWSWETASTLGTPVIQNGTLDLETTSFSGSNYGAFFMRSSNFTNADLIIGANVVLGANGSASLGTNATTSPKLSINSGGILNMLGTSKTVKSLSGGGAIYNSMVVANTNPSTLNIVDTSGSATFSGVISNGPGTGALSVTKTGASTQILSGNNTYSGPTTISGGTLVLNGDHSGATGAVNVGGNGSSGTPTLAGSGTIGGATSIAAAGSGVVGTHSVGVSGVSNGVGTQTFTSTLDYGAGSIFEWSLQAIDTANIGAVSDASTGSYDKVVANGTTGSVTGSGAIFKIVLGGNAFTDSFWNSDKNWTNIFSGTGAPADLASIFSGGFSGANVNTDGTVTGNTGHFTFNGSSTLTWSAVPEPTSALAGLLITAGLLRRRRSM